MACTFTFALYLTLVLCAFILPCCVNGKKSKSEDVEQPAAEKWKKKDVRDYTDSDVERLLEQWEDADEDKLDNDELPEWKREQPKVDMSKLDTSDPEGMLKMTKKGRSLMMFASVSGNPTEKETEKITQIWQSSLYNGNIEVQRYIVAKDRVIFSLKDGSMAWEVKDFLVKQDRCSEVTIEGKNYPGKGAEPSKKNEKPDNKKSTKDSKKSTEKSKDGKKSGKSKDGKDKKKQPKTEL